MSDFPDANSIRRISLLLNISAIRVIIANFDRPMANNEEL